MNEKKNKKEFAFGDTAKLVGLTIASIAVLCVTYRLGEENGARTVIRAMDIWDSEQTKRFLEDVSKVAKKK